MRFTFLRNGLLALLLLPMLPLATQAQHDKKPPKLKAPKVDPDEIYDMVTNPAEPEGGLEAYDRYLNDHLNFPTRALEGKVFGVDSVQFVVEKNGRISNVTLKQGFDPECDAEALRVIRAAPKWKPAHQRGALARQRITVPIVFAPPSGPANGQSAMGVVSADVPAKSAGATSASTTTPATTAAAPPPASNGPKIIQPEVTAQPIGGIDAFFKWVQDNIQYPAAAKRQKLEGKVRVEFMIEPDGSLSNVKALNRLGGGLEQEALRVIKSAPKWEPAKYQDQPIRQKMVVPVIFQL